MCEGLENSPLCSSVLDDQASDRLMGSEAWGDFTWCKSFLSSNVNRYISYSFFFDVPPPQPSRGGGTRRLERGFWPTAVSSKLKLLAFMQRPGCISRMSWRNKWTGKSCQRQLFNNYSTSPNGLWVNSPWGRRPNGLLTHGPWGRVE